MKAKTKQQYIDAWIAHLDQLKSVAFEVNIEDKETFAEFEQSLADIRRLIRKTANQVFNT